MNVLNEKGIVDLIILLLYVFGIVVLCNRFSSLPRKFVYLALNVGIVHIVFTIVYFNFSLFNVADAKGYFINATYNYFHSSEISLANGTVFIESLVFLLINYFQVGYIGCFLIFSYFSLLGIYKLYHIVLHINNYRWTNWYYLFLLPSMHFWTASIGKDSLIFFSICFLLHTYYFKKPLKNYIVPLILIGLIRFYVLAFVGIGYFIALIFLSRKIGYARKFFLFFLFSISIIFISPIFFKSVNLDGVGEIESKTAIIQDANMEGGGAVDLSNTNLLVKWISYMFRPFIFEANSVFSLIAAFENILWIYLFYQMFKKIKRKATRIHLSSFFWICFICIFTITLPASFLLSNLGIAARQKIMIVPFLFVIYFILLQLDNSRKKQSTLEII